MDAQVVVVGSGPGGAVTATLCAEAGLSVLIVEEGDDLELDSAPHASRREVLLKYRNAGVTPALGPLTVAYVEGRCVGGGSEVNRGLYHRVPKRLLKAWSDEFGVRDLSLESLAPHFEDCESTAVIEFLPGAPPLVSQRLKDGADVLGWRAVEAPRLFRYDGKANAGRRQSMSQTFIPRFRRAGGQLLAGTRALRIVRRSDGWLVEAELRSSEQPPIAVDIRADTLFLACGAVQTPALLRRSGFRRNIGDSLRFHPMLKAVAEFAEAVNQPDDLDPVHQITEFEPRFGLGCSISRRPMLRMALAGRELPPMFVEENETRLGLYYVQTTGGRASVRTLPFCRDAFVRVRHDEADRRDFAEGLKTLARALLAAGAIAVHPCVPGYPVLRSLADIDRLPTRFDGGDGCLTSVHVFSSCPMGEDPARCPVDPFGRVFGTEGLYVADASMLCTPTGVNPQGTLMGIAHRNAVHAIERGFHRSLRTGAT